VLGEAQRAEVNYLRAETNSAAKLPEDSTKKAASNASTLT